MRVLRAVWDWLGRFAESPRNLLLLDIGLGVAILALTLVFVFWSRQTHDALCHFREDLEQRVDRSQQFLDANPELRVFTIGPLKVTRDDMLANLAGQKATLKSLDGLNC